MAAPQVQTIEQIIGDLNPAYNSSVNVIQQKQAQLPQQFQAQRMALDAQKVQGFNQINNQATARGMSFSGIPLHEQANYLSTKYLPGMQALQQQENDQNLALSQALADIDKERRLKAMDIRQNQQTALEDYLSEERQLAWEREKFNAQNELDRWKEQQANARNAAEIAASRDPDPTAQDVINAWGANMYGKLGDTYRKNYSWENSGILGQLSTMGVSSSDAYKMRKRLLGY